MLQFTFSSYCMRYHTNLRICAFKTCDVSYIDAYSKIDLYTWEVTRTFVVCHSLAFYLFNYYQFRLSFSSVQLYLGILKRICYDLDLIKQKQSKNNSINRYPVYIVLFDSLYLHPGYVLAHWFSYSTTWWKTKLEARDLTWYPF